MENTNHSKEITAVSQDIFNQEILLSQANTLLDTMLDFKELMLGYTCAIKEIRTKFEVLDTEFKVRYQRNPISSIHTRLKSQPSIIEKMARKGLPVTMENIEKNLHDIAGIRVVCNYTDDIYQIAESFINQDDIELIERKDYIANPKPNGYRSLHLIVSVPIFFAEFTKKVHAEIQIRTIAMDFWASLEHQMKYKKKMSNSEEIAAQLRKCADVIYCTDTMMQSIREQIDSEQCEKSEEDIVFEKLIRFEKNLGE